MNDSLKGFTIPDTVTDETLREALMHEFDRLGTEPDKVTTGIVTGTENAVFDLRLKVVDPDGEGPEPPTGIELSWTEVLIGDYDQNGVVNINDLTPLGQNLDGSVTYDDPGSHDGIQYWPSGDPDAEGAVNWVKARVDGDRNNEININDVTPIAQHWREQLTGFRVYRKAPGETTYSLLPNPVDSTSPGSIARPQADASKPTRYVFADNPTLAGKYEYYVSGYLAEQNHSTQESQAESNHVTITLSDSLVDVTPPVWDDTIGVVSATTNTDGTVTVTWGSATDIAAPPAPASPPVTYNVYYSTESPIDFNTAMCVNGLTGTQWDSSQLIANQEYHFAVRAQDSADPPNEDTNTTEASAQINNQGAVEDTDPPVWVDTHYHWDGSIVATEGIASIEQADEKLIITHAKAIDELSPPVHYDLYYVSRWERERVLCNTPGDKAEYGDMYPEVQVIEDIPPVYEFEWPNRKEVAVHIRARDSASTPNQERNEFEWWTAPGNYIRTPIDPNLPAIDQNELSYLTRADIADPFTHTCYNFYAPKKLDQKCSEIWCLVIDMETGSWDAEKVYTYDIPTDTTLKASMSWTGEVWLYTRRDLSATSGESFLMRRNNGSWQEWNEGNLPGIWDMEFDHNGLPAFFTNEVSDVQAMRWKLFYHWYDEVSSTWQKELVSDPGGFSATLHRKPDGVLQFVSRGDARGFGDTSPIYARIYERYPDGSWQNVLCELGGIGQYDAERRFPDLWGADWAWSATTSIHGYEEIMVYGLDCGLKYFEKGLFNGEEIRLVGTVGIAWPASGGYHALPNYLYLNGEYFKQRLCSMNYAASNGDHSCLVDVSSAVSCQLIDPQNDFFAGVELGSNLDSGKWEIQLIKLAPGESIFKP